MNKIEGYESIGVVVGRFQTPKLHEGHLHLIQTALKNHHKVFVFIGVSPVKCSANDPLTFTMRKRVIEESFPMVEIYYIFDVFDAKRWSLDLDKSISSLKGNNVNVCLYGGRDSFLKSYVGKYSVKYVDPIKDISAFKIRKNIGLSPELNEHFMNGVIWTTQNQYPVVYPTVDVAVYDSSCSSILLGRKPDSDLWRFPGGFADSIGISFESDAARELLEETNLLAKEIKYIGSMLIDDPRYKSQRDSIKTLFFLVTDYTGNAQAGDDLDEVCWFKFPLNEINKQDMLNLRNIMVPYHYPLLDMLYQKLLGKK
jgi:bifunctional NMN adenylyltransferase/nudix hydrolase